MSNKKGFTLIELLIVVVIIGILAAIAIPKFANTKDKAYVAAMKSDLRNLATYEEQYAADNNGAYFAGTATSATPLQGFTPSQNVTITAVIVAVALFARRRSLSFDLVDGLLALFLLWSVGASLFATNHWLAQRSVSVIFSAAIIFWGARSVSPGSYRPNLIAAGIAAVCAAVFSLGQAYGLDSEYFSSNRAPGGTFGNRNFVAHIAVIGLPALIWSTVTARQQFGALLGSIGGALVAAALVLSRSRAAWLAVAAS